MVQFLKNNTVSTQPTHFHGLKRLTDGTLVYVKANFYGSDTQEVQLGSADEMVPTILEFTSDGNITEFDIDFFASSTTAIEVWVNDTKADPFNDYTISNDKVVFGVAPPSGKVYVLYIVEQPVETEPSADGVFDNRDNLTRELININSVFDQHKLDTKNLFYYINNNGELVSRRALTDVTRDPIDIL